MHHQIPDGRTTRGGGVYLCSDSPVPITYNGIGISDQRGSALELPLLTSNAKIDLRNYLDEVQSKQCADIEGIWLPLISLAVEKDEGLEFPRYSERVQLLMQREVENETIEAISDKCPDMYLTDSNLDYHGLNMSSLPGYKVQTPMKPGSLTPPLSPMDVAEGIFEPYQPDTETCTIELRSVPSSPIRPEVLQIQDCIEDDKVKDDVVDKMIEEQLGLELPILPQDMSRYEYSKRLQIEEPILTTSSVPNSDDDMAPCKVFTGLQNEISDDIEDEKEDLLDKNFYVTVEAHHSLTNMKVEQEQFDPIDTMARLEVPLRDFAISPPAWRGHDASSQTMFSWIHEHLAESFYLPLFPRDVHMESRLKWTPVPHTYERFTAQETVDVPHQSVEGLLRFKKNPALCSGSFVKLRTSLVIWEEMEKEEELEELTSGEDEPSTLEIPMDDCSTAILVRDSFASLIPNTFKRSKGAGAGKTFNALPMGNDSGATSKLIDSFMELRAPKRPYRTKDRHDNATQILQHTPHRGNKQTKHQESDDQASKKESRLLDLAPDFEIPLQKATYLLSLGLGRAIISHIESVWPQDLLIDRDYSQHDEGSLAQRRRIPDPLSFEADITLTPTVGIVITTLLKVKQRPLPGSVGISQLRERIRQVCQLYETLIVLVSEGNPTGECVAQPNSSDMAAYGDFVCFNMALKEGVRTYFVPGAEGTVAKWLLSFMCQYSPSALALGWTPEAAENTWACFLRRSGMNVLAAQVVAASLLGEFGAEGLARFLAMPVQQRLLHYEPLLGGRKVLLKVSQLIDRHWA
ncbi:hypothetical protein N3K66_000402 [Trichothecium roseum]|uniref:Uncharacterized protein n=1 Tax=Trichothecium roseum TaxID=47278 RepID=A0ACC0VDM6_9HYPO|nr:hypothetical protein N3K66_000402 [Trichothecium roseum]